MTDQEAIYTRKDGIAYGAFYSDDITGSKWDIKKKQIIYSKENSYDEDAYK